MKKQPKGLTLIRQQIKTILNIFSSNVQIPVLYMNKLTVYVHVYIVCYDII